MGGPFVSAPAGNVGGIVLGLGPWAVRGVTLWESSGVRYGSWQSPAGVAVRGAPLEDRMVNTAPRI